MQLDICYSRKYLSLFYPQLFDLKILPSNILVSNRKKNQKTTKKFKNDHQKFFGIYKQ